MTKELLAKDNRNSDFYTEYNTLFPAVGDECRMLIGCRRANYSASEIARAVEDCDAQLLNLNVTSLAAEEADLVVALRVNHLNAGSIARSLDRYGYQVLDIASSSTLDDDRLRLRAAELLRYLEM